VTVESLDSRKLLDKLSNCQIFTEDSIGSWLQVNRQPAHKQPNRYAEYEVQFHMQSNTV